MELLLPEEVLSDDELSEDVLSDEELSEELSVACTPELRVISINVSMRSVDNAFFFFRTIMLFSILVSVKTLRK